MSKHSQQQQDPATSPLLLVVFVCWTIWLFAGITSGIPQEIVYAGPILIVLIAAIWSLARSEQ